MATQQMFSFVELDGAGAVESATAEPAEPRDRRVARPPVAPLQKTPPEKKTPQKILPQKTPSPINSQPAVAPRADDSSAKNPDRAAALRQLRRQVGCVSAASAPSIPSITSGSAAIDALLPGGGLKRDGLIEWVADADASGALSLAMIAAAQHFQAPPVEIASGTASRSADGPQQRSRPQQRSGPLVVVDPEGTFYPPAAVALGIPAERIIWCRPSTHADSVWAIDQSLRCGAVAAVLACVGACLDDRDARRFQLACEAGRTPGLLVRPLAVRGKPSFAETRFHVTPHRVLTKDSETEFDQTLRTGGRLLQVTLDRSRGGVIGQDAWVAMDDRAQIHTVALPEAFASASYRPHDHETAALHLASQLADPAATQRTARRTPNNPQPSRHSGHANRHSRRSGATGLVA